MEMIYAAMLLHSVKQPINEDNLKKVLTSVGAQVEEAKIKGVVASLEGINIEEAITKAAMPVAAASAPVAEKKEEHHEEDTAKTAESAAAGLGALFG